jgi:thiosulfate dehydrogenase
MSPRGYAHFCFVAPDDFFPLVIIIVFMWKGSGLVRCRLTAALGHFPSAIMGPELRYISSEQSSKSQSEAIMADNKAAFSLVVVFTFAVVGGVLSLLFGNFINFSADTGIPTTAPARPPSPNAVVYNPPTPGDAPEDIRDAVLLGYNIMVDTRKYAAPFTGNKLRCVSCHFRGGITEGGRNGGLSLVGVGAVYPRYRSRQEYASDLVTRTNSCFERSMNGKSVPPDSREMAAIVTYYQWISRGLPIYGEIPWLGLRHLKEAEAPDKARGGLVYGDKCAACHGRSGEGTRTAPPLWGEESFNDGAGMSNIRTFSAFVHQNMPFEHPEMTEGQALDVAAFVTGQPRAHFTAR